MHKRFDSALKEFSLVSQKARALLYLPLESGLSWEASGPAFFFSKQDY